MTAVAFGLIAFASSPANANGSWGSSYGSYGSSGGFASSGGYASSGGSYGSCGAMVVRRTPVRNFFARIHARHQARHQARLQRRYASYGSSGGSSGGMYVRRYSYASQGSWGSYGSSGGSVGTYAPMSLAPVNDYYQTPTMATEQTIQDGGPIDSMLDGGGATQPAPTGADAVPAIPSPGPDPGADGTSIQQSDAGLAVLNLNLPVESKVYINGRLTATEGSHRSYVSKNLNEDRDYSYKVKAVLVRNGKELVRTKLVKMRPGLSKTVDFDFDQPVLTTLALEVPDDAKVKICGREMTTTGSVRSFTTDKLKDGDVWKDYKISVEYQQNGKPQLVERTIDLTAGEIHRVAIGVDSKLVDQVASK